MRFKSDKQRRAVFASLRDRLGKAKQLLGTTSAERRQLGKRALLGTAVTGMALGTALAARRLRSPAARAFIRKWALRSGLAGLAGTLATTYTTAREHIEQRRQKLGAEIGRLAHEGTRYVRTFPVEAVAARGVDEAFGRAEGAIHRRVAYHAGELEKLAGAKIGGYQALATTELAGRARRAHKRFFAQPRGDKDIKSMQSAGEMWRPPKLEDMAKPRRLRAEYQSLKVLGSARALVREMQNRGMMPDLVEGKINREALFNIAKERGHRDYAEIEAIANLARAIGRFGKPWDEY